MSDANLKPALFLDRDGVIIENRADYVRSWDQVKIYPWALEALACPSLSPFRIIIVSNQSAIGRGLVTAEVVESINRRLVETIRQAGGRVDGVYTCPHTPADGCACRKPRPGLITRAAAEMNLDLRKSILVGDALEDIQAGRNAGVRVSALVQTGRGDAQLKRPEVAAMDPFLIFARFDVRAMTLLVENPEKTAADKQ